MDIKHFITSLLDLIYKRKCYFCGSSKDSLSMCAKCYEELTFSDNKPNRIVDNVNIYSAGIYEKNLQKLIRGLKYHKQSDLAHYLAKFLYEYIKMSDLNNDFVIVPVPLHKNRIKKRKYNHMELVAKELSILTGWEYETELITREKDTKPQYKLTKIQRLENLKDAFDVSTENYNNKPILIIDDICTTGSTFEEMIRTLKSAGITDITCLAASTP